MMTRVRFDGRRGGYHTAQEYVYDHNKVFGNAAQCSIYSIVSDKEGPSTIGTELLLGNHCK